MTTGMTIKTKIMSFMLCLALAFSVLVPMNTVTAQAATKKINILMIGNSLTYTAKYSNSTIRCLKNLGANSNYTFNIRYIAYGGECLETYANTNTSRGKEAANLINSRTWDVVILQQETDHAIKQGNSLKKAAKTLATRIRKKSPKAKIIMNCTWAYDKKKLGYTHAQQQKRMNANYAAAAKEISAKVVYSGNAFDQYRKTKGALNLYRADKNHATEAGWYLNACCLQTGITEKTPYKIHYYDGLGKQNGLTMQKTAASANKHLIVTAKLSVSDVISASTANTSDDVSAQVQNDDIILSSNDDASDVENVENTQNDILDEINIESDGQDANENADQITE